MTGSRKFIFACVALLSLSVSFVVAVKGKAPADLFDGYAWALVGLVAAFGGTNGIEHISKALGSRKGGQP